MKVTEQTLNQIERAIRKIAQKFSNGQEATYITDIHLRVLQHSGELRAYDDDDNEITRCVVEEWIDNKSETFYEDITEILRQSLQQSSQLIDSISIPKPFSFVLEDDDKENIAELYLADDDTIIISGELMADLDKDLDAFFNRLIEGV